MRVDEQIMTKQTPHMKSPKNKHSRGRSPHEKNFESLAIRNAPSEYSDQTVQMRRLI